MRRPADFLEDLKQHLNEHSPSSSKVLDIAADVKASNDKKKAYLNEPEAAWRNTFVILHLHEYLVSRAGMDKNLAKKAFLCEGHKNPSLAAFASGSPAKTNGHPFQKALGPPEDKIFQKWERKGDAALVKSCPDMALREPCKHKIVFETKYYTGKPGPKPFFVRALYECFFYLSLPKREGCEDCDYACLLAYDATQSGILHAVWNDDLSRTFWESAHIYIMLLRAAATGNAAGAPSGQ
jgi:hypothetical protein